jgi:hypothetical protein
MAWRNRDRLVVSAESKTYGTWAPSSSQFSRSPGLFQEKRAAREALHYRVPMS